VPISDFPDKVPDNADLMLLEGQDGTLYRASVQDVRTVISYSKAHFAGLKYYAPPPAGYYEIQPGRSLWWVFPADSTTLGVFICRLLVPAGSILSIKAHLGFLRPPTSGTNLRISTYKYADSTLIGDDIIVIARVGLDGPDAAVYAHALLYVGAYAWRCMSLVLAVDPSTGKSYLRRYTRGQFFSSAITHMILSSFEFFPYSVDVPSSQFIPMVEVRRLL